MSLLRGGVPLGTETLPARTKGSTAIESTSQARPPGFVVLASLAKLATEASEELDEIDLESIEDCDQLDGINAAISGFDFRHPCLKSFETFSERSLRDTILLSDGGQQFRENFVVVAVGCGSGDRLLLLHRPIPSVG